MSATWKCDFCSAEIPSFEGYRHTIEYVPALFGPVSNNRPTTYKIEVCTPCLEARMPVSLAKNLQEERDMFFYFHPKGGKR